MVKKLLLLVAVVLTSVSAMADLWVSETPVAGGKYYLFNKGANSFIEINEQGAPANTETPMLITLTEGLDGTDLQYTVGETDYYLYQSAGTYGYCVDGNKDVQSGRSTATMQSYGNNYRWKVKAYNGGYQVYSNHKYESYLDWFTTKYRHNSDTDRYITYNGSAYSCSKNNKEYNTNNGTWLFISEAQYEAKVNVTAAQGNGPNSYWTNVYVVETYAGDNDNFVAGKVLSKSFTDLKNGYYTLEFYATASKARGDDVKDGAGIAQLYVTADGATNTTDMTVWLQDAVTPDDAKWLHTYTVKVTDGTLEFGIQNVADGGNWYTMQYKSLTYLGDTKVSAAVNAAAQYATFCAPFEVALPAGVTASTVDAVEGGLLTLTAVEGAVPANTPVVLYAEAGLASTDFYGVAEAGDATVGLLTGVYVDTDITEGYVLQKQDKVGFYEVASTKTVPAFHAYLTAPAGARFYGFGDETAIDVVEVVKAARDGKFVEGNKIVIIKNGMKYNVAGQRVK